MVGLPFRANATDWLQFGYDPAHSGNNNAEPGYSTATGNQRLYTYYPSPTRWFQSALVYVADVTTLSARKNLLFTVTRNGELLALNAADGTVVWSRQPVGNGHEQNGGPAVDPGLQFIYAAGSDGNVHKYQIGDGTEVLAGGWPQVSTLKPQVEKSASPLGVATTPTGTYLYSPTSGYYHDSGDYQGHITTINLVTGTQTVFNTLCSNMFIHFVEGGNAANDCVPGAADGVKSGIWGRAGVVYSAATNRIYVTTGNGLFDANTSGGREWGDSILALKPDGTGSGLGMPVDSYTPTTYASLYTGDIDLGSMSPAIVPAPSNSHYQHLAVQSGKDGCVRLINLDNMSGQAGPGHVGGELNADACTTLAIPVNIPGTQPAVWVNPVDKSTWVFVAAYDGLYSFQLVIDVSGNPSLVRRWVSPHHGLSPVVANGQLYFVVGGTVYALNPTSGATIWSDASSSDYTSNWLSPIVVDGHVYVLGSSSISAYALDGIFRNGLQ